MAEQENAWDVYMTDIEDHTAVVAVNADLAEQEPDPTRPVLITIVAQMTEQNDDGLPTDAETQRLDDIDDTLVDALSKLDAVYAGRITTNGQRWMFYYVAAAEGAEAAAEAALQTLPFHARVGVKTQNDAEWNCYFDFLYPAEAQATRSNRHVLAQLAEHGDQVNISRPIEHYAYFPTPESRENFASRIEGQGFEIREMEMRDDTPPSDDDGEPLIYGIHFTREDAPLHIDGVTLQLMEQAYDVDGEYDGWETQIVTA
jgi:uncharacterized protein (TIGR01619 family)